MKRVTGRTPNTRDRPHHHRVAAGDRAVAAAVRAEEAAAVAVVATGRSTSKSVAIR